MLIKEIAQQLCLIIIGLSGGVVIAGGVFAFIAMIGIIPRLMFRTGTSAYARVYENMVVLGGILGNTMFIFGISIPFGTLLLLLFGLSSGVFVGCLAMALAEGLRVIPVFVDRIKLEKGLPFVITSIAVGKAAGAFYQLYLRWGS